MVEANSIGGEDLRAMFANVAFSRVPDMSHQGKPDALIDALEALKKTKGKAMSDNPKAVPAEVKAIGGKSPVKDEADGFDGAKADGKKSGKAKQYWKDGSFFDGFMLEDTLCKGRFYFANGDFF